MFRYGLLTSPLRATNGSRVQQEQSAQLMQQDAGQRVSSAQPLGDQLREIADRRIWLPRLFYESLPLLYILVGSAAVLSTIFNRHWSWMLPHVLLLGCFLVHLGLMVRRSRLRARRAKPD